MNRDERVQQCFSTILCFDEGGSKIDVVRDAHAFLCVHIDALLFDAPRDSQLALDGAEIAYAIVAFADEQAMKAGSDYAEYWAEKTLQVKFFQEHAAGDNFYKRLRKLRERKTSAAVLYAYYTALMLGFEGRLATVNDSEHIFTLIADLSDTIAQLTASSSDSLGVASQDCGASAAEAALPESFLGRLSWWTPQRAWRMLAGACAMSLLLFALSTWYLRSAAKPIFQAATQCVVY